LRNLTDEQTEKIAETLAGAEESAMGAVSGDQAQIKPGIVADQHLNAVIVRDAKKKMPFYKALIDALDVPTGLVEINATIFDVSTADVNELGIDWTFGQTFNKGKIRSVNASQALSREVLSGVAATQPAFSVSTVIASGAWNLAGNIRMLESRGKAKIRTRPAVTTFDNIAARIEQSESFHVRVVGEKVVDLVPIDVGMVLAVTPHIVQEDGELRIMMAVQIEDGSISQSRTVDGIPSITRSSVSTQALIGNDESLLVGGLAHEELSRTRSQVPFLGNIPIIGAIFRKRTRDDNRYERIFMITPRIISPGERQEGALFSLDEEERAAVHDSLSNRSQPQEDTGGHGTFQENGL
jgi:type III secretion protein C